MRACERAHTYAHVLTRGLLNLTPAKPAARTCARRGHCANRARGSRGATGAPRLCGSDGDTARGLIKAGWLPEGVSPPGGRRSSPDRPEVSGDRGGRGRGKQPGARAQRPWGTRAPQARQRDTMETQASPAPRTLDFGAGDAWPARVALRSGRGRGVQGRPGCHAGPGGAGPAGRGWRALPRVPPAPQPRGDVSRFAKGPTASPRPP